MVATALGAGPIKFLSGELRPSTCVGCVLTYDTSEARPRPIHGRRDSKFRKMKPLAGLLAAIRAATTWLAASEVPHAIVGGVAASLHGKPRVTKDVDLVALAEDSTWSALLEAARKQKIQPRIQAPLDFAKTTRVLLLVHKPSAIEIDLSFGMLPFEREVVERAVQRKVKAVSFSLATAEDVVVMKALALRPRDVVDIEGILDAVPDLDLERVRKIVSQLSAALEGEDHLARLEAIVHQARQRR